MTIEQLYQIANDRGIQIYDFPMSELRAVSLCGGHIAIDRRKIESDAEYKCVLAHEIGHCETNTFYTFDAPMKDKDLCEYHANRFAAQLLVPLSELRKAMHKGILFANILARMFNVTVEFAELALELFEPELISAVRTRPHTQRIGGY